MTDQPANPRPDDPAQVPPSGSAPPEPASRPPSERIAQTRTFDQRMEDLGRRAGAAGERFGRDVEDAAGRWSKDPSLVRAADTAARAWGLLILAVGLWFLADVTLGMDMPAIAWREVWPVALIVLGLAVLVRGMAGRRT